MDDKQKIIELLQKKLLLEKKKYDYWYHYHTWVEMAPLKIAAFGVLGIIGTKDIKKEDPLSKILGWIWLSLWIFLTLLIFYKLFKFCHYYERIRSCERKIFNIDKELINSASR